MIANLEQVIDGLESYIEKLKRDQRTFAEDGIVMSTWQERADAIKMIKDALALIKDLQEGNLSQQRTIVKLTNAISETAPRLLQAEDFYRADAGNSGEIPCWKEPKSPTRREGWAVIVYGKWLADKGVARYWTGKPSEAQKEAVKWDG